MFESRVAVEADDAVSCADALVASILEQRLAGARRMALVAAWADYNHPDSQLVRGLPREDRVRRACIGQIAAEGTPTVSTHAITELGMLLQTTTGSAEALLRDVLELRHRLPAHWDAVLDGRLEAWKARQIAKATRVLGLDAARAVDVQVIDATIGLPWGRALAVVEGKVIAADPASHQARLDAEENKRFVSTRRRSNNLGLRTLIARGAAGDIARLEAMIAHLATQLQARGDTDPVDTRRAKALAMLANPALTCLYLAQTHDSAHDTATDPTTPTDEPAPLRFDGDSAEEPVEEEPTPASPVELAVTFGQMLQSLGTKVIDRLRPRSVLYLHLSAEAVTNQTGAGVARVDDPVAGGPISTDQLRAWLAHDRVTIQPVLDPTDATPVDGYEIPHHLREALHLLAPYETFPYGTLPTRQADADHTKPYVPTDQGGPPGQTALDNLGPLGRRHHLAKTFAGFEVHQPVQGTYLWRTPTGHWYQVDHRGTTYTGKTPPALLDVARNHDAQRMRRLEAHFRTSVLRHIAA